MIDNARADDTAYDELGPELAELRAKAFAMALVATERGDFGAHAADARALDERLSALRPRIEAAGPDEQPAHEQTWSDARLDLGYVLSAGELPTSNRLSNYFEDPDAL